MELVETQGLSSFNDFLVKLETDQSKAAQNILKDSNIIKAKRLSLELVEGKIDHPKIEKLKEVVTSTIKEKKDSRIIIFANYRNTVDNLVRIMTSIGIVTIKLVGQKEGLTQKQQIETIDDFNRGKYNCLIATSIAEEGLHIGEADVAIFYDNTPSSIRKIQRSGRVGRLKPGRVIFMITKGTRDAAYHWKSQKDEKRMKGILYGMKDKPLNLRTEKTLDEF